jgi:ABC-type Zn2+ transport system substrate-binding protein/surface adhesin
MDEWVKTMRMKKTMDLVDLRELEKKNRKKERLKNDEKDSEDEEHEGMDENAIAAHEEATKVKTVLEIGNFLIFSDGEPQDFHMVLLFFS